MSDSGADKSAKTFEGSRFALWWEESPLRGWLAPRLGDTDNRMMRWSFVIVLLLLLLAWLLNGKMEDQHGQSMARFDKLDEAVAANTDFSRVNNAGIAENAADIRSHGEAIAANDKTIGINEDAIAQTDSKVVEIEEKLDGEDGLSSKADRALAAANAAKTRALIVGRAVVGSGSWSTVRGQLKALAGEGGLESQVDGNTIAVGEHLTTINTLAEALRTLVKTVDGHTRKLSNHGRRIKALEDASRAPTVNPSGLGSLTTLYD